LVQISSVKGIATQHKKTSKVLMWVTPVPKNASLQYKTETKLKRSKTIFNSISVIDAKIPDLKYRHFMLKLARHNLVPRAFEERCEGGTTLIAVIISKHKLTDLNSIHWIVLPGSSAYEF
jgi:hypothetical protein